ncbi:MAG: hypothetical protein ACOYYS_16890, partial [Chloroflexota bacterium]
FRLSIYQTVRRMQASFKTEYVFRLKPTQTEYQRNTLYRVLPSNILWSGMEYRWKAPQILIESSDHRLWFQSDNGMTWLDPEKGEWCWFTTEQSNIVEDSYHNLWMVADNKLYKLDLGK